MATKLPFAQGAQVEHPKFGLGSVLSCDEERIVIKFDDHGEKKFVLSIVLPQLKKSDRTPPPEKRRTKRATKKKAAAKKADDGTEETPPAAKKKAATKKKATKKKS